jgi:hypothetical protein
MPVFISEEIPKEICHTTVYIVPSSFIGCGKNCSTHEIEETTF